MTGFRLGRIFGITIAIDWSWFFIFLLVTVNLGLVFSQAHPDWEPGLRWIVAIGAALLFFISVLLHELAHSLVARAQRLPVRNITLFLFGGVSNIERNPPSPQVEFLITIVGPVTSLVLGALLLGLARTNLQRLDLNSTNPALIFAQLDPLTSILLWLGPVNIALGLFNLIPGFPLDGGRILRSILWALTDNLRKATRWASWIGQVIAWLFIIAGVAMIFGLPLPFFGQGFTSGLWLALIGWFLCSAAIQSYRQIVVHDLLEGVPVAQLMRAHPPTVPSNSTVSQLVHDYVMNSDDHAFPVVDQGRLVGLVTLDDIRHIERERWDATLVQEIMTPTARLATTTTEEDADRALRTLAQRDVRQLPVLQRDGQLAGLLCRRDIVRWLQLQEAT